MFQEKSQKRGIGRIIGIALIVLLVILIMCTFVVYGLFKGADAAPALFGYRIYIMNNDTMGEQIKKGAAVFIKEGLMPTNEGNVILVTCPDTETNQNNGENSEDAKAKLAIVAYCGTQDVIMPDGTVQAKHIVKYGNAPDTERWVVNTEDIIGKAESYDPAMGAVIRFVSSKAGVLVMIIIPCALIVIYEIVLLILSMRKKVREAEMNSDDDYGYQPDSKEDGFEEAALGFGRHNPNKTEKKSIPKLDMDVLEDRKAEERPDRTIAFRFDDKAGSKKPQTESADISPITRKPAENADDIPQLNENYSNRTQTVNNEAVRTQPAAAVSPASAQTRPASAPAKQAAASADDSRSSSQRIDELMKMLREETEKLSGK